MILDRPYRTGKFLTLVFQSGLQVSSAILWGQLEHCHEVTTARLDNFSTYHTALLPLQERGLLRIPTVSEGCTTNGHIFYIILPSVEARVAAVAELKAKGISAFSHYVPLHSAPGTHSLSFPSFLHGLSSLFMYEFHYLR